MHLVGLMVAAGGHARASLASLRDRRKPFRDEIEVGPALQKRLFRGPDHLTLPTVGYE